MTPSPRLQLGLTLALIAARRAFIAGAIFQHPYPFVRDVYDEQDEDGWHKTKTWKPGIRMEPCGPEDVEAVADGIGAQRLTIIGTFKPGRFPERVFFTRIWISPSGKEFGNPKLRITTLQAFRVLAKGYRHEFWPDPAGPTYTPHEASAEIAPRPDPQPEARS